MSTRNRALIVCAGFVFALSGATAAQFQGAFETVAAFDPSASGSLFLEDASYLTLEASYSLSGASFASQLRWTSGGLEYVGSSGSAQLGEIGLDSQLIFYPIGEAKTMLKTTTEPEHVYDLWRDYFIDSLLVENVNSTSDWQVRVSLDGTTWTTVSSVLGPAIHSTGIITVSRLIRYVRVQAIGGLLQSSFTSPETLTLDYSNCLWQSDFAVQLGEVSAFGTFILPTAGSRVFVGALSGPIANDWWLSLTLRLAADAGECDMSFQEAAAQLSIPSCLGPLTVEARVDCLGFDELTISAFDLLAGVPTLDWVNATGVLTFETSTKQLLFTPRLNLEAGPCITVYGELITGSTSTEIGGVSIYGLECDVTLKSVTLTSLSYLDEYHFVPTKGSQLCWEMLRIATVDASCCGGIQFDCAICFSRSSSSLFGWAETDFEVSVGLGPTTTAGLVVVAEETGISYLEFSLRGEW